MSDNEIRHLLSERKAFKGNTMSARVVGPQALVSKGRLNDQDYKVLLHDLKPSGAYVVFSYETPIAWVTNEHTTLDEAVIVVSQKFSVTTSRQQNLCRANL
jgi:hypothetical protein